MCRLKNVYFWNIFQIDTSETLSYQACHVQTIKYFSTNYTWSCSTFITEKQTSVAWLYLWSLSTSFYTHKDWYDEICINLKYICFRIAYFSDQHANHENVKHVLGQDDICFRTACNTLGHVHIAISKGGSSFNFEEHRLCPKRRLHS